MNALANHGTEPGERHKWKSAMKIIRTIKAFRPDWQKNSNYRGFRIIDIEV